MSIVSSALLATLWFVVAPAGAHEVVPADPPDSPDSPGPRRGHALVFDEARKVVLLFGGMRANGEGSPLADDLLWSFDGRRWSAASRGGGPVAREHANLAYDAKRRRVVLYGGTTSDADPTKVCDDTWEWDGAKWSQSPAPGPGLRVHSTMAFDPQRGKVLLFGGFDPKAGKERSDLLEWDGSAWKTIESAPPPTGFAPKLVGRDAKRPPLLLAVDPKQTELLAFEWSGRDWSAVGREPPHLLDGAAAWTGKGGVVVFGGFDGKAMTAATWRLQDGAWTKVEASGPSARGAAALAFDAARGRAVLYGGASASDCFADTWEFDGAKWSAVATTPAGGK